MVVEYKRDLNCNYLILHGDIEIDTGMYQVRMLTANVITCLLPCRLQSLDGLPIYYYDITSKHSLAFLVEHKKFTKQDLEMIFFGILHGVEEMASFLMNHNFLWLNPEGIYIDVEKKKLYFCCIPGYTEDLKKQMKELTEFLLPKLDHDDMDTVNLGYKIYRVMLEEEYQIDKIKEVLYGNEPSDSDRTWIEETAPAERKIRVEKEETKKDGINIKEKDHPDKETGTTGNKSSEKREEEPKAIIVSMSISAVLLILLAGCRKSGYLSWLDSRFMIGIMIAVGLGGVLCAYFWSKKEQKKVPPIPLVSEEDLSELLFEEPIAPLEERMPKQENPPKAYKHESWIGNTERLADNAQKGTGTLVSKGNGEIRIIVLERDVTILGKLPVAVDEVIEYPTVSRIHAKIRKYDGEYYVSDLNSRNGTYVNGTILQEGEEVKLSGQDVLALGEAQFVFSL